MNPGTLIIFFTFTFQSFLIGQLKPVYISKHYDKEDDCQYIPESPKLTTSLEKQRRFINCLVYRRRDISGALSMIDSINSILETDDLLQDKIEYLALFRPYDTLYFGMQRHLIDKNHSLPYSLARMGMYYMNYVAVCSTDSSKIKLTPENKIKLLEVSAYYFNESLGRQTWVNDFSFVFLPDVLNELQLLKGVKLKTLFNSKVKDSLTIIARIPDCGEFGSHFEYIKLHRKDDSLSVQFTYDSIACQAGFLPDRPIYKPNKQNFKIDDDVLSHKFFKSINTLKRERGSNAPLDIFVYLDGKFYEFSDWDGKSTNRKEYESFKKDIFK